MRGALFGKLGLRELADFGALRVQVLRWLSSPSTASGPTTTEAATATAEEIIEHAAAPTYVLCC